MCPQGYSGMSCSGNIRCRSHTQHNGRALNHSMRSAPDAFGPGKIGMERFRVATKANPWYKDPKKYDFVTPTYGLKPELVKEQLRTSIKAFGYVGNLNVVIVCCFVGFHLHFVYFRIANISGVGCSLREYHKTSDRCLFDMNVAIAATTKEPSLNACLKATPPHPLETCIPVRQGRLSGSVLPPRARPQHTSVGHPTRGARTSV